MLVCSERLRTETAFQLWLPGLLLFVDGVWLDRWKCWHIPGLGLVQVTSWPSTAISCPATDFLAFSWSSYFCVLRAEFTLLC